MRDDHIRNLYKGGLTKLISIDHFHRSVNSAVLYLEDKRAAGKQYELPKLPPKRMVYESSF